jgi:deoxyribonuclease V
VRGFDELTEAADLESEQRRLAALTPESWRPPSRPIVVAGAFVAFARGQQGRGRAGDHAHVGAAATRDTAELARIVVAGDAGAPYAPGLLAAREGALLAAALHALFADGVRPDVLLIDATGRDHPRRSGLALHLGAMLERPSIGVTHRPLLAIGPEPDDRAGAWTDLTIHGATGDDAISDGAVGADSGGDGEVVGRWLRTRTGVRPLAVHAGWRTDVDTATDVVMRVVDRARTPEPLRLARCAAREARAAAEAVGRAVGPAD